MIDSDKHSSLLYNIFTYDRKMIFDVDPRSNLCKGWAFLRSNRKSVWLIYDFSIQSKQNYFFAILSKGSSYGETRNPQLLDAEAMFYYCTTTICHAFFLEIFYLIYIVNS